MTDREEVARRAMTVALRTAAGIVGSREEAADIAQEVALDALRSADRLRDPQAFDAWVRKIAVRHSLRALRKRRAPATAVPIGLGWDFADVPAVEGDRDLLIAARGALALRYVHDLTDREIADALGCRRGTVNALLSRGRAALRQSPALRELISMMEGSR
jgi:DNA-directed RNA polymerase specialized sigma24 family protein